MATRDVTIARVSPVSAFKVGLATAILGFLAWILMVSLVYLGMDGAGIVDQFNTLFSDVGGDQTVTFGLVFAAAALFGAVGAIVWTLMAPLMAIIYNAVADLIGGLEVTSTELY